MKKEDYIVIQGWMIKEFNLKGNELIAFALIYGFTKDLKTEYNGSLKYLGDWLNCSKPTCLRILNDLIEKGLITKTVVEYNSIVFNKYRISEMVVKYFDQGGQESLPGGGQISLPNNTNIYNTKNNIEERKQKFSSDVYTYLDKYDQFLLDKFISYWTEPNKSNTRLKYELEKTWDTDRRLSRWISLDSKYNKTEAIKTNLYREL